MDTLSTSTLSKFETLVKQNELSQQVATQLYEVLNMCEIVLVCDDSGSMAAEIAEDGLVNNSRKTTRWSELKKLAAILIEFVTSINPNGLDIYFLNRGTYRNINDMCGLQNHF